VPRRLAIVFALGLLLATAVGAKPARIPATGRVPAFKHVILVVFENHSQGRVLDYPGSPFEGLADRYALLDRYDAVAHPSLPNYLALTAGSTFGLHRDCTACVVHARNLADTLAARGLTWKMYVEHLPLYLSQGTHITGPEKARLPFLYFADLQSSGQAARSTVPLGAFFDDLRENQLPSFSLVIPDLCHDMHSCSIAEGDRWLHAFMQPLLEPGRLDQSVVFLVFDEGRFNDLRGGGGRVAAVAVGPQVKPGAVSHVLLDHYSLLRTIEDSWGLPPLGRSASARPITGIWR
jgi:hypothetical protein